jgi:phosphoribosylanthranilate isomerase
MALKTFVKVSSVDNLSDARYCAGMYVNWMGFNLEESSPSYLSPDKFREITEWLSGLEYVGEFENSHPDTILQTIMDYDIHRIQIREAAHVQMLLNTGCTIILKQFIRDNDDLLHLIAIAPSLKDNYVILLLESDIETLTPELTGSIRHLAEQTPVLLGFGFNAETVEEVLERTQVKGIALNGGDEIKPGIRDFDELADILEVLEEDE